MMREVDRRSQWDESENLMKGLGPAENLLLYPSAPSETLPQDLNLCSTALCLQSVSKVLDETGNSLVLKVVLKFQALGADSSLCMGS